MFTGKKKKGGRQGLLLFSMRKILALHITFPKRDPRTHNSSLARSNFPVIFKMRANSKSGIKKITKKKKEETAEMC